MNQLNNKIKIDRADGAADNASKGVEKMSNASKKMPWHLRFAPGAILRNGLIAVLAIATALTTVQTKAAIFTIDVITSWVIGEGLTAAKNKLLNDNGGMNKTPGVTLAPTAKAVANTAYWLSNSYDYTHKEDEWNSDTYQWKGNWTTTTENASQLRQDNNESLSGTNYDGTAMTQAEAKGHLLHSKASYTHVQIELFTNDYDPEPGYANGIPYDGYLADVWVFARTDRIHWAKLVQLELLKRKHDDRSLYWGPEFEKITYSHNVGSYEMESKFENVTGHAALSDNTPDDPDANDYEGTVYWTYHKVNVDGTTQVEGIKAKSKYEFKSYEPDSSWVEDLCDDHQTLSVYPNINNSARRRFENQRYKVRKYGPIPLYYRIGITRPIHRIGWYWEHRMKRVVVQEED